MVMVAWRIAVLAMLLVSVGALRFRPSASVAEHALRPARTEQDDDCPANSETGGQFLSCVCKAGFQMSLLGVCEECPLGKFKSARGNRECDECGNKETTTIVGQADASACVCGPGYTGLHGSCTECPVGTYKQEAGDMDCSSCGFGATTVAAASDKTMCICKPGYSRLQGSCTECPMGTYKDAAGDMDCTSCNDGATTEIQGSTSCVCKIGYYGSQGSCQECPDGMVARRNSAVCTLCGANSKPTPDRSTCECDEGYTSSGDLCCPVNSGVGGDLLACECNAGFYMSEESCKGCPEGTFKSARGNDKCIECGPNSVSLYGTECVCSAGYQKDAQGQCTACPLGTFKDTTGNGACTACPAGQFQDQTGQTDGCKSCQDRRFESPPTTNACVCKAGLFGENCEPCPQGYYKSVMGDQNCLPCNPLNPNSETTLSTGNTGVQHCVCNAGFYGVHGSCKACAADTFATVHSSECSVCRPHSKSMAAAAECLCDSGHELSLAAPETEAEALTETAAEPVASDLKGTSRVAYSSDGSLLATVSAANALQVWDVNSESSVEGTGEITSVVFSRNREEDGSFLLATGSADGSVRILNSQTLQVHSTLEGHTKTVNSLGYSANGNHLATGSEDCHVRIWDIQSSRTIAVLEGHEKAVNSVAYSPDGKYLATGSDDYTVRIWEVSKYEQANYRPYKVLEDAQGAVNSVVFSSGALYLATGSDDKNIRIYQTSEFDSQDPQTAKQTLTDHQAPVNSVVYSQDGQYLASGSQDATVRLWNAVSGQPVGQLEAPSSPILSLAFSPDGAHVASQSPDSTVRIWDVSSQSVVPQPLGAPARAENTKGAAKEWACRVCPEGTFKAESGNGACTSCPTGQFQTQTGQAACQTCSLARYQSASTTTESCTVCSAGHFGDSCEACPQGKYKADGGSQACTPCNPSHPSSETTRECGNTDTSGCVCNDGYMGEHGSCEACVVVNSKDGGLLPNGIPICPTADTAPGTHNAAAAAAIASANDAGVTAAGKA